MDGVLALSTQTGLGKMCTIISELVKEEAWNEEQLGLQAQGKQLCSVPGTLLSLQPPHG